MTLLVKRRSFLKAATAGTVSLFVGCEERGEIVQDPSGDGWSPDGSTVDGPTPDSAGPDSVISVDDPGHRLVTWALPDSLGTV